MEKNITITANDINNREFGLSELWRSLSEWASTPARLLARYYSSVLEREVTMRQTWRLIEVQIAFFAGIFPADISVALRLLSAAWFISALLRCKRALSAK